MTDGKKKNAMRNTQKRRLRKIVLIGAGSSCFTAAQLQGLLGSRDFDGGTVGLVDINPATLGVVEAFARRLVRESGKDLTIVAHTDRREVLKDADWVSVTVSVGGDNAWSNDLTIPARHGWIQSTGDTCGIGGLSRGLRHVPVLVGIARDMEALCPSAWMFNYTNPMSILTRAVWRETAIKCMGLCVGVDIIKRFMSWAINAGVSETSIHAAGINHFMFAYAFGYQGRDAYPLVRRRFRQALGKDDRELAKDIESYPGLDLRPDQPIQGFQKFSAAIMDLCGYFPGPGDSHISEFLPHFFRSGEDYKRYGVELMPIGWKREHTARHLQSFEEMARGQQPIDMAKLGETYQEEQQGIDILHSQLHGSEKVFFVNLPNRGQIPNLPPDAVVEGPTRIDSSGATPLPVEPLPELIAAWTRPWCAWQEKVVDAALAGSRDLALDAMLMDPGCRGIEASRIMLDELLAANAACLPRFHKQETHHE